MQESLEIILKLTMHPLPAIQRRRALHDFAQLNGWKPSDEIEFPATNAFANGHLIVEYGLENSAVLSFLNGGRDFDTLSLSEQNKILEISYNNLIEWHFFPTSYGLTYVFNRSNPLYIDHLSRQRYPNAWRVDSFNTIIGKRPNPNIKSLDDALVDTISFWKRRLASEIGRSLSNENISALFNAIILIRAIEDQQRWEHPQNSKLILDVLNSPDIAQEPIKNCLHRCYGILGDIGSPDYLIDDSKLAVFNGLDKNIFRQLITDFYLNHRSAPYHYDFSLMSKHALSRIYEHYVSIVRDIESNQIAFFPQTPEELIDHRLGGIYTPQYVARFFGKFLQNYLSPREFRNLSIFDPACGSGIFPRTILEMQFDAWHFLSSNSDPNGEFEKILAIDVDPNACQATILSLCLLYLTLKGKLPKRPNVIQSEAIEYLNNHKSLKSSFDVVVTNPPFITWDKIPRNWKPIIIDFMENYSSGKTDMALAFLKLGMDAIKPGGYLMYVMPYSFLVSDSAQILRREISKLFHILYIVDLSKIPVFGKIGTYIILLILQKKSANHIDESNAICVRCKGQVGFALEDAMERNLISNEFYSIFEIGQSQFEESKWTLLTPRERRLQLKMKRFGNMDKYVDIREGFISGSDDIFIRLSKDIPKGEEEIYKPFLPDREMQRYKIPHNTGRVLFYPYIDNKIIELNDLKRHFPQTWSYLESNRSKLRKRQSIQTDPEKWWRPIRPRKPQNMFRPKIVTPHLILLPKFSLDMKGKYAVSHSPFLYLKNSSNEAEHLIFLLALLNSSISHWQIANICHRYGHGYYKLEKTTLSKLSLPDPAQINISDLHRIITITEDLMKTPRQEEKIGALDNVIADIYELNSEERTEIGILNINVIN